MRSDRVDPLQIGANMLRLLGDYVERLLRFRDAPGSPDWVDIDFESFVADPISAIRSIYAALEIDLHDEALQPMRAWVAANPRNARRPNPDLRRFGIEDEHLHHTFGNYCERFGLDLR
jgi:hypothetical protein